MQHRLHHFCKDESGAATVEWVLLVAFVTGLSFAVVLPIAAGAIKVASGVSDHLEQVDIAGVPGADGGAGEGADGVGASGSNGEGSGNDDEQVGNPGNDKSVGKAGENPGHN